MTGEVEQPKRAIGIDDIVGADVEDENPLAEKIASLEAQLSEEKDRRLEDRFIGLVVFIIFFDIAVLHGSTNLLLPVVVLILELVILLLLAKRMGSEDMARLIDRILHSVSRARTNSD